MILLRQKSFSYGIRAVEIGDYAKKNNISVSQARDILYKQAQQAGKDQYGTYAAGDKGSYRGSQLRAVKDSTGKNTVGIQGQTGSGMFTVGNKNKKSSGYAASQAVNQSNANATRRNAIKQQQQQAFKQGQQSVGILGGAKNTWDSMNNTQKGLAIGGTAAVLAGGTALAIRNRNKRKKAERELEEERARNRR